MEAIESLSIDDQLGLLWVLYENMGGLVTPPAPGATVQLKIERGIKTQIITT
ncbi:orange carotenoid protein N-terminal domain-containing protein [Moorena sp. SIO4A1]|uniref:orange carotenoid protein N-terminal domain-containing protein n=1 Tax=Moorena sp. SIO4A1 TaxID=2607835 RepID=UPI0025E0E1A0|nr:orange carotenoid protein N-terminal domain-containing protein [Moorena sp. SIO4A1]